MKKILMLSFLLVIVLVTVCSPAFSATPPVDPNDATAAADTIKTLMQQGDTAVQAVTAVIQQGFNISAVLQAAITFDNISLNDAVSGAIAAGTTADVIARTATTLGVSTLQQVATALSNATGLAYTPATVTTPGGPLVIVVTTTTTTTNPPPPPPVSPATP